MVLLQMNFCTDDIKYYGKRVIGFRIREIGKRSIGFHLDKIYPSTGATVPGGVSDYRLIIRNPGNVTMDNITIVDVLPFVGDQGLIDTNQRNSRWRPNLIGAVDAPSGFTNLL